MISTALYEFHFFTASLSDFETVLLDTANIPSDQLHQLVKFSYLPESFFQFPDK